MVYRLLYTAGLRVDEIAHLAWRDLRERDDAGQVTAYGKAGKTRVVLLPATVWRELLSIRDGAPPDAPVFASRTRSGFLTTTQVRRLVYAAAAAGLDARRSPHWLRHAHATHALERGRGHPPGPGHPRSRLGGHHRPVPPRAADRQLGALPASLMIPASPRRSSRSGKQGLHRTRLGRDTRHQAARAAVVRMAEQQTY